MAKPSATVIGFSGAATIRTVDEIAERLKQALAVSKSIEIDCSELGEVDLTFIQIVTAARKSALAAGKTLGLKAPARGCLLAVLNAAGIQPAGLQAFWFEGSAA